MVLYLDGMCKRGLHAVLWSHIGTLMHRLAAEPCSTAGLLFHFRCPSGTILLTLYSMVWDWRVSRAGPMLLYWPKLLYPYYSFSISLLSVYTVGWYCGAGVFLLIFCISLSLSLALPTFFNNNKNTSITAQSLMHGHQIPYKVWCLGHQLLYKFWCHGDHILYKALWNDINYFWGNKNDVVAKYFYLYK